MLNGAKLTLKKLLYDDSGVAMAYTVLVSLFIFMLSISTYAMSENIRQKMELQNACDAAAYSGAVVQADMLSRIAVLNRALSWTYAQSSKRHMDYIVDTWIGKIQSKYNELLFSAVFSGSGAGSRSWNNTCRTCGGNGSRTCGSCGGDGVRNGYSCSSCGGDGRVSCGSCGGDGIVVSTARWNYDLSTHNGVPACHICTGGHSHGEASTFSSIAGWFVGWTNAACVELNRNSDDVRVSRLYRIVDTDYMTQLNGGRTNIATINTAIDNIRANMNTYIANAVDNSISAYSKDAYTYCIDNTWRGSTLPGASYFNDLRNENTFLRFSNYSSGDFGRGTDVWWQDTTTRDGGIQRSYVQGVNALRARFRYWATLWAQNPYTLQCYRIGYTISPTTTADILPTPEIGIYGSMQAARPVQIQQNFWGRSGTITVAAKKTMLNPFTSFMETDNAAGGVYGGFKGINKDMWVISTARAGLRFSSSGPGSYQVFWPGDTNRGAQYNSANIWNLCEEDWDAVMLPVTRAWNDTRTGAWGSQDIDTTTSNLVSQVCRILNVNSNYKTNFVNKYNPFNPTAEKK